MIVEKILKQITPERARREVEMIKKIKLPENIQKWVDEYEKVGKRDGFIWKWAYYGWNFFILPTVDQQYKEKVLELKLCCTILNALIDDIIDKKNNKKMLLGVSDIIFNINSQEKFLNNLKSKDREYVLLIKKLWDFIQYNIKKGPRYKDFVDIFTYDYQQFFNTMNFSYLIINNPDLISLIEHNIYSPHNMKMMIGATIDLIFSSKFDKQDLGVLRNIVWYTQQMGRIGNLVNTWEKEIKNDLDFTSGIFAYALNNKFIAIDDLYTKDKNILIKKVRKSEAEKYFLQEWEQSYNQAVLYNKKLKTLKLNNFLTGSKKFLIMHLISRGLEI